MTSTWQLTKTFLNPTPAIDDFFGYSVAISGDNVLTGARFDDTGAPNAGAAYLFRLVETPATLSINDVTVTEGNSDTTNATFTFTLSNPVSTVVSVDYATANGTATADSTSTATVTVNVTNFAAPPAINLSSLNGSNGFSLQGIKAEDQSGNAVSGAGDVNGDGVADLIIGAFGADPGARSSAGESYLVFGGAGVGASGTFALSALNGTNGFTISGVDASYWSGGSVSAARDVNGDGFDDLILGASGADPNGKIDAGESYVIFGGPGVGASGSFDLSSLNGSNGFALKGIRAGDLAGVAVAGTGDISGDNIDDLLVGASKADPNGRADGGEAYLLFGGAGIGGTGSIELANLNGSNGFALRGINGMDLAGISLDGLGDFNNDGFNDLIVGASGADPNNFSRAGESYVFFGFDA